MNRKVILDQIVDILKKDFQIEVLRPQVVNEKFLELGVDSIEFMMLCVLLEEALSCTIRDDIMIEKVYSSLTVRDLINSVAEVDAS